VGVRVGVVAVAVVFAVAGCSAGDAPSAALPSGSAPPQSSPPTKPPLPATATQDTPAGAQSFARYWLSVLDYATTTGDTRRLLALGACVSCIALAKSIDALYASGGRAEGGRIMVIDSSVVRYVPGRAALVRVDYDQMTGREIPGSGVPKSIPAQKGLGFAFALSRRGGSWTVAKLQTVETN
jgi:hypothetical protein